MWYRRHSVSSIQAPAQVWVSSQNLAGPACRELVGADQKQRSIVFVKPPGVSFRRSLAAIQARLA